MHCVRRDEYIKGYRKYKYFDPYFTVLLNGRRSVSMHSTFYVEVDKDKPEQRHKYRTGRLRKEQAGTSSEKSQGE